jgi:hypothetical protein
MTSALTVATMLTILFLPGLGAARFKGRAGGCGESARVCARRSSMK